MTLLRMMAEGNIRALISLNAFLWMLAFLLTIMLLVLAVELADFEG